MHRYAQLVHQEEELRREEEAYYEAKRKAQQTAKVASGKSGKHRTDSPAAGISGAGKMAAIAAASAPAGPTRKDPNAWLEAEDSDWEM